MTNTHMMTHDQLLDRLAEVAVAVGVNLQEGQDLLVTADVAMLELTRKVVERAYKRGAGVVTVLYDDEAADLARFQYGHDLSFDRDRPWLHEGIAKAMEDGRMARLRIVGGDPNLLAGVDPDKTGRAARASSIARKPVMSKAVRFETNWSIIAGATSSWAKAVFPGQADAENLLWKAIFAASRVDESVDDPVAAWARHNAELLARRNFLDGKQYAALRFRGPGTDLEVGLADGHVWGGGLSKSLQGVTCNPNIPTEEVFTTPHRARVSGYVSSTKPLSRDGSLIEGIRVRFEEGAIVEASCNRGQEAFEKIISTDEGARRLGEVALVPHSSPISASGILFYETLFDENASSHIALGQSYAKCMQNGSTASEAEMTARGANSSLIHVDWMIGSGEIDVDGLTKSGETEPLMRAGEWAFPV